ncbi:MAG TPA: transcription elongation factor GreB [Polyangiaceae bacterium LLY-WYZ-15_(1-7)]|nr:transcription elongation factor GreB [Sandaracinus sp.]HJK90190.1 transcription elongation factor GreB [Polyangiaceae bacterium LLY-WYZ-15_(1-7)]MBJ74051.1 transcription elongation factor GreB [Sandaracinus sp.]HJL06547.1 transcription elongation factor GreB [Polyangiaceae bacterium LLY-WYZ-15_(1-7)]HJL13761.1 transcription elongation factor GreB [Polyangiaceae bacterium LLY-WYZ-15_(1-7)]|tara:strand:- start:23 stop:541 length:519 start_codon:yes stop_codon:yes gene_type:complete
MARTRRPRPKQSGYITPEGHQRYEKELFHLWNVERPKIVQGVAEAAAEGDRSENAEYIYGKKKLREIDRRIQHLSRRLEAVKVVDPTERRAQTDRIFFGAWVRCEDEEGEVRIWRIVGPDEHDMDPRYVSMDSPIGRALLGKRLDDEVLVERPKGDLELVILAIGYDGPPEE